MKSRVILTFLLVVAVSPAAAIVVPSAQFPTIQSGVTGVCTGQTGGDPVVDVLPGVYNESITIFGCNGLILRGNAANPASVVIDRQGAARVLDISGGVGVQIEGLTIRGGNAGNDTSGGGGARITVSSPRFVSCIFEANFGVNAGAIAIGGDVGNPGGTAPIFENCIIQDNSANVAGGAVTIGGDANPLFLGGIIQRNVSGLAIPAGIGGALFIFESQATPDGTSLIGNTGVSSGGAIHMQGKDYDNPDTLTRVLRLSNCIVADNESVFVPGNPNAVASEGGGVHVERNARVRMSNCRVSRNRADSGGGVNVNHAFAKIVRSLIIGNQATGSGVSGFGGGILSNSTNPPGDIFRPMSRVVVKASTIRNNTGAFGGGITGIGDQLCGTNSICPASPNNRATLVVRRSIIDKNVATGQDNGGAGINAFRMVVNVLGGSVVVANRATGSGSSGGGIFGARGSVVTIDNATVTRNSSTRFGGGVAVWDLVDTDNQIFLSNSRIYKNTTGDDGGGLFIGQASGSVSGNDLLDNSNFQFAELDASLVSVNYTNNEINNDLVPPANAIWLDRQTQATFSDAGAFNNFRSNSGNTASAASFSVFTALPPAHPSFFAWSVARAANITISPNVGSFAVDSRTLKVANPCEETYSLTAVDANNNQLPSPPPVTVLAGPSCVP